MKLIIINGPNLNLQGIRQTDIYGTVSFDQLINQLRQEFPTISLEYYIIPKTFIHTIFIQIYFY